MFEGSGDTSNLIFTNQSVFENLLFDLLYLSSWSHYFPVSVSSTLKFFVRSRLEKVTECGMLFCVVLCCVEVCCPFCWVLLHVSIFHSTVKESYNFSLLQLGRKIELSFTFKCKCIKIDKLPDDYSGCNCSSTYSRHHLHEKWQLAMGPFVL